MKDLFRRKRDFWYNEYCKISDENVELSRQKDYLEYENYFLKTKLTGGNINLMGWSVDVNVISLEKFEWLMKHPNRAEVEEWCREHRSFGQ